MINVQVFNAHARHRLGKKPVMHYVHRVMKGEGKKRGDVSVIFMDSRFCRKLNKQYLNHDYVTDVISFDLHSASGVEGEVYINLDRAKQQARSYKVSFSHEVARLVIHGCLHLAGYSDGASAGRKQMRTLEDHYLRYWFSNVKAMK